MQISHFDPVWSVPSSTNSFASSNKLLLVWNRTSFSLIKVNILWFERTYSPFFATTPYKCEFHDGILVRNTSVHHLLDVGVGQIVNGTERSRISRFGYQVQWGVNYAGQRVLLVRPEHAPHSQGSERRIFTTQLSLWIAHTTVSFPFPCQWFLFFLLWVEAPQYSRHTSRLFAMLCPWWFWALKQDSKALNTGVASTRAHTRIHPGINKCMAPEKRGVWQVFCLVHFFRSARNAMAVRFEYSNFADGLFLKAFCTTYSPKLLVRSFRTACTTCVFVYSAASNPPWINWNDNFSKNKEMPHARWCHLSRNLLESTRSTSVNVRRLWFVFGRNYRVLTTFRVQNDDTKLTSFIFAGSVTSLFFSNSFFITPLISATRQTKFWCFSYLASLFVVLHTRIQWILTATRIHSQTHTKKNNKTSRLHI